MSGRAIAATLYSAPDLIPANLKRVALVIGAALPSSLGEIRLAPGALDSVPWGVVVYQENEIIPDNLLKVRLSTLYSATPTAPTPTLGAELFGNPGFDTDTVWVKQVGWTIATLVATHTGAVSLISQDVSVAGLWHRLSVDLTAYTSDLFYLRNGGVDVLVSTTLGNKMMITRAINATCGFVSSGGLSIDNGSAKALTLSTCFTLLADAGGKSGVFDCAPTLTANTQGGIAICLNSETSPLYFLLAYHDGTNANLDKCENGVYTSLISAAAAYSAGAQLRILKVGDSVRLYYGSPLAQVGTTQTVDTTTGYGAKVAVFSTLSTNTPGVSMVQV